MPPSASVCRDCGEPLEVVQSFTDDPLTMCPVCGGELRKKFHAVGISFKGSGFYKKESGGWKRSSESSSSSSESTSSGTSSSSDKKSEKKSDAKSSDSKSSS